MNYFFWQFLFVFQHDISELACIDPALFERSQLTEAVAQKMIHDTFSPRLLRRYIGASEEMPSFRTALFFSHRKERWTKGRTRISFSAFPGHIKATSRALDSICTQTWPQDLGQFSIPQIRKKIHHHFEIDDSSSLTCVNDDLVGVLLIPFPKLVCLMPSINFWINGCWLMTNFLTMIAIW